MSDLKNNRLPSSSSDELQPPESNRRPEEEEKKRKRKRKHKQSPPAMELLPKALDMELLPKAPAMELLPRAPKEKESSKREKKRKAVMTRVEGDFKIKWIDFFHRRRPIVLQDENGPCSLVAICNVLLLREDLDLKRGLKMISKGKLLSMVAELLMNSNRDVNEEFFQQMLNKLPKLLSGLDLNIKFDNIDDFEYSPEVAIFEFLDIPLVHGWLIHRTDKRAHALRSKYYNTVMNNMTNLSPENKTRKLVVDFVENSTQLTDLGISKLRCGVRERKLCVFFRNKHFNTLIKYKGRLHTLAADEGYVDEPGVVWETLDEVNGSSIFLDGNFKELNPVAGSMPVSVSGSRNKCAVHNDKSRASCFDRCIFRDFLMSDRGGENDKTANYLLGKYIEHAILVRFLEKVEKSDRPIRFENLVKACRDMDKFSTGPYKNFEILYREAEEVKNILGKVLRQESNCHQEIQQCIDSMDLICRYMNQR